jgi:hypothetical protein
MDFRFAGKALGRDAEPPEVKSGEVQQGSVFASLLRVEAVTLKGSAWST